MTERGKNLSSKDAVDVNVKQGSFAWFFMPFAIVMLVAGIVGYYVFLGQNLYISFLSLAVGIVLAVVSFLLSEKGKQLIVFTKEARMELRRVTWPSKTETSTMTKVVLFVLLLAMIFLGIVDGLLNYIMQLLLSWR